MFRTPALVGLLVVAQAYAQANPAQYVNALIGTANGGHVFPGATLPWGSAKAGADAKSSDNAAGFPSDGTPILGISQMHDDGTGGSASLGNFKLMPMYCNVAATAGEGAGTVCVTDEQDRAAARGAVATSPGYFSIGLNGNITAEVTVTDHTALHRFTYSALSSSNGNDTANAPVFLLDLVNDLSHTYQGGGSLVITNTSTGTRLTGGGTFSPSFGVGSYSVNFCLDTSGVDLTALYQGNSVQTSLYSANPPEGEESGVLFQLNPATLAAQNNSALVRIGVSFVSASAACAFAESEIPSFTNPTTDFSTIQNAATERWNEVLGSVDVDTSGVSSDVVELFWSSLYRTYISPINVTGDNPLWDDGEPYYESYYCIWDSFRVVHPLYSITQPATQAEMVRSLLSIQQNLGWLPDCRMSDCKGYTQGGSNADTVIADSFVKLIDGDVDWNAAYTAIKKDATTEPNDWLVEGRGGITSRAQLGYVPVGDTFNPPGSGASTMSASRTLEYAYNDFGIALVAAGLGNKEDYNTYLTASADWYNLWNNATTSEGYTGFIQPRYSNGSWDAFDPLYCSPVLNHDSCFLGDPVEFYEAASWEYSFFAPHDMARLVTLMGGPQTFINRLDEGWDNTYFDIGDEPSFLLAYLYNYAGAPSKTVDRVLSVLAQNFNTSTNGLPGNDDSGAMGGYVVYASFGFFPIAGQAVYLLATPQFPQMTFTNGQTGNKATIVTKNFDGATSNKYIQSAMLNGRPYDQNWISHSFFTDGGTLELVLGSSPSSWGTTAEALPPSLSTGGIVDMTLRW